MGKMEFNRRQLLAGAALAGAATAITTTLPAGSAQAAVTRDPFGLGIASGDPLPDGVILWTRLVRDPYDAEAMGARPIMVRWQVAHDEGFRRIARAGACWARRELAHAVHVDVRGLQPGRGYFYRFRVGGHISPVGRTRTAPAPLADPQRLRLAVVSCQDFQNGYWPAFRALAEEDLDVVLHLGDYIYETDPASDLPGRSHVPPQVPGQDQLSSLDDFRRRHAQYKADPALRAAHAAFPWAAVWDDHETEENYAGVIDAREVTPDRVQTPEQFAVQRANAYQAYYEHMPIRADLRPGSPDLRIYRRFDFGRLARVSLLDTRQYRTDQPGGFPSDLGPEGVGRGNLTGSMTGEAQERWLTDGLTASPARWNVIAQQVMMSRVRLPNPALVPPLTVVNLDQWDGYHPQRQRLLQLLADAAVANPVVLSGDIHSTWISDLKLNFDDPASSTVAVEFTGTSISSVFPVAYDAPLKQVNPSLNPHVRYFDGLKRGYLRCDIGAEVWRTDVRVVDTVTVPDAPVRTDVSFAVEAGRPGVQPA